MANEGLRKKKSIIAKQNLYNAAMDLFQQKGFDETTIDEIAERAGYSRATFFNHFGTKIGVLRQYGQRLLGLVENHLNQNNSSSPPLDLIREMISIMVREAEENIDEVRLVCTYSLLDPNYLSNPTPARKRLWELLTELVLEAQRQKHIRSDLSAQQIALHIFCLYQGVVLSLVADIGNADSLLHSAWQFIQRGVSHDHSSVK